MHTRFKPLAVAAAIMLGWFMGANAQSAGFFGGSSNASGTVPAATPSRPSASQVWSKDDFSQKTTTLKTQNEAQYQKDFNAKLKPMPTQGSTSTSNISRPVPAGSSPAPTSTPSAAPTTTPAAQQSSTSSSTGTGYTGFSAPSNNSSGSTTTTPTKSSGWGVTY